MLLTMGEIVQNTGEGFGKKYPPFKDFQNSARHGQYWALCMQALQDRDLLGHIIFCNDLFCIPPVKTFLCNYAAELETATGRSDARLDDYTKKAVGAFWGYVFKAVLGYTGQKSVSVSLNKQFLIKTATYYHSPEKKIVLTY